MAKPKGLKNGGGGGSKRSADRGGSGAEPEDVSSEEEDVDDDDRDDEKSASSSLAKKESASLSLSGKLAADEAKGVEIKYSEPPEARVPKIKWRLYPFKGAFVRWEFWR